MLKLRTNHPPASQSPRLQPDHPPPTRPVPLRPIHRASRDSESDESLLQRTTRRLWPSGPSALPSTRRKSTFLRQKTLVLDLDETLIHASLIAKSRSYQHIVEVNVQDLSCLYYVYKRPHLDYFLKKYADPVIDALDPSGTMIKARYFRESCIEQDGNFLKDLTLVDPDLSHVCLVDNSPASYSLNQAWYNNNARDEALLDLLPFLDALRFTQDVRSILGFRLFA
ncbi:Nuclear envelope morphology protein 1 [Dimargaris verticillata]|uniref:Mitochondrial import inner membrane translocase subunit TIM50 n=1 Tax=Dimargaris verticillata TaxID=2761393 RepID=A0A9W8E838_9FUNG|nr:Nuclear envelope morphology protein 1 [Dimargaris verticillata]